MVSLLESLSEFLEATGALASIAGALITLIMSLGIRKASRRHLAKESKEIHAKIRQEEESRRGFLSQISKRESQLELLTKNIESLENDVERLRAIKEIRNNELEDQVNRIKELSERIRELENENKRLLELKKLNEKQVQGLILIIEEKMEKFGKKSRIENISIAAFFFFLGMFASIALDFVRG